MLSPVYQYVVNLVLYIKRCPSKFMNVIMLVIVLLPVRLLDASKLTTPTLL